MSTSKQLTEAQLAARVKNWNERHPIGTAVRYCPWPRSQDQMTTKTRSKALVLGWHTAVVMVEDVAGCVALESLQLIDNLGVQK